MKKAIVLNYTCIEDLPPLNVNKKQVEKGFSLLFEVNNKIA